MPNRPSQPGIGQIAVVLAVLFTLIGGALAASGELFAAVADTGLVLFEPARYAFAIWTPIYLGLLAFAVYQAQPRLRADTRLRSLELPVVIGSAANVGWLVAWQHQRVFVSVAVMLVLLASLAVACHRLEPERELASLRRRWCVHYPLRVYLGWVTIAAFANLAWAARELLARLGRSGDAPGWVGYALALVTVLTIAGLVTRRRADVAYLVPLVWGVVALAVTHQGDPIPAALSWLAAAALVVMVGIAAGRRPGFG